MLANLYHHLILTKEIAIKIAKKIIKRVIDRHQLRKKYQQDLFQEV